MAEYISRQMAIDRINKQREHLKPNKYQQDMIGDYAYRVCAEFIGRLPPADVLPVRRGRWVPMDLTYGRSYYFCSACEETVDMPTAMGIPMFRYCPNCCADMREV